MSEATILENNKLIAEFMGFVEGVDVPVWDVMPYVRELKDIATGIPCSVPITEYLAFDTSYDWLMPVIEKIVDINDNVFWIIIGGDNEVGFNNNTGSRNEINYNGIESTYQKVVEFIKWYNKNEKK
jgi:hypothetical protein